MCVAVVGKTSWQLEVRGTAPPRIHPLVPTPSGMAGDRIQSLRLWDSYDDKVLTMHKYLYLLMMFFDFLDRETDFIHGLVYCAVS